MGAKKDILIQPINLGKSDNKARIIIEEIKKTNSQGISRFIRDSIVFYYENINKDTNKQFEVKKIIEQRKLLNKRQKELAIEVKELSNKLEKLGYLE